MVGFDWECINHLLGLTFQGEYSYLDKPSQSAVTHTCPTFMSNILPQSMVFILSLFCLGSALTHSLHFPSAGYNDLSIYQFVSATGTGVCQMSWPRGNRKERDFLFLQAYPHYQTLTEVRVKCTWPRCPY